MREDRILFNPSCCIGLVRNLKTIYSKNLLLKLVEEGYDDLRSFWKNLTVLDGIYYVDAAWKLVKSSMKNLEDLRKLDCSENVDEEAVEQWINEDSTLECCEVFSDDVIVSRVTCGSEETRNFEECPESDKENLVTHQKLSIGDALEHTEALLNYLEQEDESTPAEQMILRNLRSIIRRRGNEKQKQTSIISFFTKMW
ncbi:hypothetical protein AVEN_71189-1 [Araneus ventricosus]|uniref:DDE-1 domain-containing protein n=1 Tax=Araneus ventricosus TaxID=182803 RepID=A0A4Y2KUL8_ARAVE|nr:hypothetical protein AVEN_71189-1 [Araneus ventricosus]